MKFFWKPKTPSSFKLDLVASLTASAWSMLVQLACVPLYIKFLGVEAYGLIGFYLMLQTMLQVLDLGLSPTMNREMARYSVHPDKSDEARDLVRTLESGYWLIGVAVGAGLVAASPWVATHWIKSGSIPVSGVKHALLLMGILAALQWPVSFYQGGLIGLHKQILFNVLRILAATLSNVGAVLILWLVSPKIETFFSWLVLTNAVVVVLWTVALWKSLPPASRSPRFDLTLLKRVGIFAAGMSGITAAALVLTQADKVILSRVLTLKAFGYYSVAGMFGAGLALIVSSVFNTVYPRLSALVAREEEQALRRLYHRATQLMAVLILPLAVILAIFSADILYLWTRNAEVARNAGPIATLLVIGSAINGLMYLPYSLQLAHGWTSIGLRITVGLTLLFVPAIWFMATTYGVLGAAAMWPLFNCVYMAIGVPLTHRHLLKGEAWKWLADIALPLLAAVFIAAGGREFVGPKMPVFEEIILLMGLLVGATGAAAFASPSIRHWLIARIV